MAVRHIRVVNDGSAGRPAALAAGARSGPFTVASWGDDVAARHVTGLKSNLTTALVHIQLDIAGKVIADIDCSDFNTAEGFVTLDYTLPPGVLISLNIINDSAGAVAINTMLLSVRYEAPSTQG